MIGWLSQFRFQRKTIAIFNIRIADVACRELRTLNGGFGKTGSSVNQIPVFNVRPAPNRDILRLYNICGCRILEITWYEKLILKLRSVSMAIGSYMVAFLLQNCEDSTEKWKSMFYCDVRKSIKFLNEIQPILKWSITLIKIYIFICNRGIYVYIR